MFAKVMTSLKQTFFKYCVVHTQQLICNFNSTIRLRFNGVELGCKAVIWNLKMNCGPLTADHMHAQKFISGYHMRCIGHMVRSICSI